MIIHYWLSNASNTIEAVYVSLNIAFVIFKVFLANSEKKIFSKWDLRQQSII